MNDPIISPWIFYLAYLAKMSFVLIFAAIALVLLVASAYNEAELEVKSRKLGVEETDSKLAYYMNGGSQSCIQLWMQRRDDANESLAEAEEEFEKVKQGARRGVALTCVLIGLWVIIPNETTIYRMVVAQYVTPHNLQVTGETIENIVDKTVNKILKLKQDKK